MSMRPRLWLAGCLMVLGAPLWASPATSFSFGQPAPAAKATRTVELVMGDMSFSPGSVEVKAGETVRFVLVNKGQLLHEFNLGDAAMHAHHQEEMLDMLKSGQLTPTALMPMAMDHGAMDHSAKDHGAKAGMTHDDPNSVLVEPGKTGELTWTFSAADKLQFACNIPGHYQAGMVGTLKVDR